MKNYLNTMREFVIAQWDGHDIYIHDNNNMDWSEVLTNLLDLLGMSEEEYEERKSVISCRPVGCTVKCETLYDLELLWSK